MYVFEKMKKIKETLSGKMLYETDLAKAWNSAADVLFN